MKIESNRMIVLRTYILRCFWAASFVFCATLAEAQEIALKTNLLFDGLLFIPNLAIETPLSGQTSFGLYAAYAPFEYRAPQTRKILLFQPGVRYWLCDRFNGSFFGAHLQWGAYNMGGRKMPFGILHTLRDHRYEGQLAGLGVSYGYTWPLSKHWGVEAEIGVGYAYLWYKKYKCESCGELLKESHRNYVGPTKAGVNLIYQF